ncbi:MAG: hypothetical protein ACRERE_28160 [Candidatus Entotheonellia bacterium]
MKQWLVAAAFVMAVVPHALCTTRPARATGIYSNMSFHEESGDVLGIEVFVMRSSKGYFVVFQSSEGAPAVPVVVPVRIDGKSIEFDLPAECAYAGKFKGTLTEEGITGGFPSGRLGPDGSSLIRLKRGKSYWQ